MTQSAGERDGIRRRHINGRRCREGRLRLEFYTRTLIIIVSLVVVLLLAVGALLSTRVTIRSLLDDDANLIQLLLKWIN